MDVGEHFDEAVLVHLDLTQDSVLVVGEEGGQCHVEKDGLVGAAHRASCDTYILYYSNSTSILSIN